MMIFSLYHKITKRTMIIRIIFPSYLTLQKKKKSLTVTNLHLTHHLVCLPMLIVAKFCLRKNDHELMEVRYYCLYAILLLRSDACYQLIMSWLFIVFHCISLCCCRHFASLSPPLHTCDSDLFCLTFDVTSITTMCTPFSVVNFSSGKKKGWRRAGKVSGW